jgi:excisionase family DNA binding protein
VHLGRQTPASRGRRRTTEADRGLSGLAEDAVWDDSSHYRRFTYTEPFEYLAGDLSRYSGRSLCEGRRAAGRPVMSQPQSTERLLTPGEVAALFRVDPKTVTRWASAGRIGSIRTPGGHRRFRETEVRALLASLTTPAPLDRSADRAARKNAG